MLQEQKEIDFKGLDSAFVAGFKAGIKVTKANMTTEEADDYFITMLWKTIEQIKPVENEGQIFEGSSIREDQGGLYKV